MREIKTIALIPARAGSKRIPEKNTKLLGGKPLVMYTIEAAIEARAVDFVFLTTESDTIRELVRELVQQKYGKEVYSRFEILYRPAVLAMDTVQLDAVVWYSLLQVEDMGLNPETVVLLQPTSPFRTAQDIDAAMKVYKKHLLTETNLDGKPFHTVISCSLAEGFYWENINDELIPVHHDPAHRKGKQWIHPRDMLWKENGAIYITDVSRAKEEKNIKVAPFTLFSMNDDIDLDTEEDWGRAERKLTNVT